MPLDIPEKKTNFIQGISSMGGTGEPTSGEGLGIHLYVANQSMNDCLYRWMDRWMDGCGGWVGCMDDGCIEWIVGWID